MQAAYTRRSEDGATWVPSAEQPAVNIAILVSNRFRLSGFKLEHEQSISVEAEDLWAVVFYGVSMPKRGIRIEAIAT